MTTATTDPADAYLPTWTRARSQWFTRPDGSRLRYVTIGNGPPLLLMHTVRTQLDHFQRLIPLLARHYRVYAVDFPGMGWSDIVPGASYDHDDLLSAIVELVRGLDLRDLTLVGESMGAVVSLTASVALGDRVIRVVASNTYDYPQGLERANAMARIIIPSVRAPIVGPVFAALENRSIVKGVVSGGYADPARLPAAFVDELVRVGARKGYPRVARAIYRNLPSLIAARGRYPRVSVPTTLIYTTDDWSRATDRQKTSAAVPNASVVTIDHAGHFCAMEKPDEFARVVLGH